MIVFNEGLPGSGKSYDAVLTHILPALRAGRHVYARLNGLDDAGRRAKIAAHLGVPPERVDELLHHVTDDEVGKIGELVQKNALIVIDECHEFYVASREALPAEKERLFAMHRHEGLDIVLMSQFYKRLHSAVRGRVERKAIFTKLNVAKMKDRYKVEHWQAVAPDKYEKVDSTLCKYDPAIFPLYKSVADGTTNLEVYEAGSVPVWRKIRLAGIIVVPLALWGCWKLAMFFSGHSGLVPQAKPVASAATSVDSAGVRRAPSVRQDDVKKARYDVSGMPPEIAYVFDLANQARARMAAIYFVEGRAYAEGIVEFRADQQHVLERISLQELRELGFIVTARHWGASIGWRGQRIVATAWPIDMPDRISDETNRDIDSRPPFGPAQMRVAPSSYGGSSSSGGFGADALLQGRSSGGVGGTDWPHPDFRYQVPFPGPVKSGRN